MEKHYGNYLGIVVNSNDPEYRNRLQIWIPNLSNTLYTNWNENFEDKVLDYGFNDPNILERLTNSLPWAECASPLFGGGTSMRINPSVRNQPVGDSTSFPVEAKDSGSTNNESTNNEIIDPLNDNQLVDSKGNQIIQLDGGGYIYPNGTDVPQSELEILFDNPDLPIDTSDISDTSDLGSVPENNPTDGSTATVVETDIEPDGGVASAKNPNVSSTSTSWQESTPDSQQILNNLRIKDKNNGTTITMDKLNLSNTLDNLENTGLEAFSGGYNDVETLYFAGLVQNSYNDSVNRVTAVNDAYHVNNRPNSNHTKGNKFDITFNSNVSLSSGGSMIKNTATKYGLVEGQDYKVISTYHGTGPHVDVELLDSGRDKLSKIRTGNSEKIATAISGNELNNSVSESNIASPSRVPMAANGTPSPDGQAKGIISSPSLGAKVWVFFYGGDIQKPVYFATAISPEDYGQALGKA